MKKATIFSFVLIAALLAATRLQAQTDFTQVGDQPVMDFGAAGEWDAALVAVPSVILDGDTLRMWYTGADVANGRPHSQIGYAWSLDGVTWNRYAGNPVLTHTLDWEVSDVQWCAVRKEGDTYKMWYSGRGDNPTRFGYATSTDGINWTKHPEPILQVGPAGDWDDLNIRVGSVIREANRQYKMWYLGTTGTGDNGGQTGLATSSDGINWVKYDDPTTPASPFSASDPVLKRGAINEDWDGHRAYGSHVLQTASGYEMWYTGAADLVEEIWVGYATSADGISWIKWPDNPIIHTGPAWGSFYSVGTMLKFDDLYHFWFMSWPPNQGNFTSSIGYATSPIAVSVASGEDDSGIPSQYHLFQNYPNPFNPVTTIQYRLPKSSRVVLKVYNILGEEVATLVNNELQDPGSHVATWNGRNAAGNVLASGIYLTRMQAGIFVQTRKMLLIQ